MLHFSTAGESHGPALTALVLGMPAGVPLSADFINTQLARRQQGYGRGGRMRIETDRVRFTAGVRGGLTLGSPLAMEIENRDWANWQQVMDPAPGAGLQQRAVTKPRPGHADLPGGIKYRQLDLRNILERASARETAARVAAGSVGRALLQEVGIGLAGHVTRIGAVEVGRELTLEEVLDTAQASPVLCGDPDAEAAMIQAINAAREAGDSLGGVVEIIAWGVPVGLGSHTQWDRRLDGCLAQALMSIPAIKGVEIGMGFGAAALPGSAVHDEIFFKPGRGFYRQTNRAGGLEGGITNGEPLVVRAAMKPIPTLMKPLRSVDIRTREPFPAAVERSDVCAVPAAAVVAEAMVAFVLARALLEKFPADSLSELREALRRHQEYVEKFGYED